MSRDTLASILWPEATEEEARTVLRQTLYTLRRDLEAPGVVAGSHELRLNPEMITSDVAEFESALDNGRVESAVALYHGPLLDGIHLTEGAEFERWVAGERRRLELRFLAGLEWLAMEAQGRDDWARAIDWWQRLSTLDPLSSRFALGLMRALAEGGHRAEALRHAERHQATLREELGSAPDPSVAALTERLRDSPPRSDVSPTPPVERVSAAATSPRLDSDSPTTPPLSDPSSVTKRSRFPQRPARRITVALGGAVVFGLATLVVGFPRSATSAARDPHVLAIAPFRMSTTDSSLLYLEEGIVELLGSMLSDTTVMRAADPRATIAAWRRVAQRGSDYEESIARSLGAGRLLTGSVVGTRASLTITASIAVIPTGESIARASVVGSADSVLSLVEKLAVDLSAQVNGESPGRLSVMTSTSLPAVRAYLVGQADYRRGKYAEASTQFRDALQLDSMFALAGLRLALASGWAGRPAAEHDYGLARAWAARARLIPRDRAFLDAFATGRIPQLRSDVATFYRRWELALEAVPDWPEVWFEYGDMLFHQGDHGSTPDARKRAATAMRRAIALDSLFAPAVPHLIQLEALAADTAAVRRLAKRYLAMDSTSAAAWYIRWQAAIALGDATAMRAMREGFPRMPRQTLRWITLAGQFDGLEIEAAAAAASAMERASASDEERRDALLIGHSIALNRGRRAEAVALLDTIGALRPRTRENLRLRITDALYSIGDPVAAGAAARVLARGADAALAQSADARILQYRDLCVLGQWRVAHGEYEAALRSADRLARSEDPVGLVRELMRGESILCSALVRAQLATARHESGAFALIAALDSTAKTQSAGEMLPSYPIAVARLYDANGRTAEALQIIRGRPYFAFDAPYVTTALREEGLLARRVGDHAGAAKVFRLYLALRANPDPWLEPDTREIRSMLDHSAVER